MAAILDRIANKWRRSAEQAALSYTQVVKAIALDDEPADELVEAALAAADKTPEQLAADVSRQRHRNQLVAQIAEAEIAQRDEMPAIDAKIAKAREAFDAAREVFETTVWPLEARKQAIAQMGIAALSAKSTLRDTADPALSKRVRSLQQEALALTNRINLLAGLPDGVKEHEGQSVPATIAALTAQRTAITTEADKLAAEMLLA